MLARRPEEYDEHVAARTEEVERCILRAQSRPVVVQPVHQKDGKVPRDGDGSPHSRKVEEEGELQSDGEPDQPPERGVSRLGARAYAALPRAVRVQLNVGEVVHQVDEKVEGEGGVEEADPEGRS